MKGKVAAIIVILYAVVLFAGAVQGAMLRHTLSIYTIPVTALLFIAPAIGVYRRANWCRIFLGVWAVFVFCLFVSFSFRSDFQFRLAYLGFLLGTGIPVFLLFFYSPLKEHTRNVSAPEPAA